ncbi:hypothetical protein EW146_g2800 [Bondarzewia mesenterica]|uniref:Uncharacterized protein n=1 Tax=Bondarzewia mesenterica TaxID=1095465 RepID=A0A4S4LZH7_9AGAM|nr:hypothetical protein EW146_g2800 [Bondarzewia mesenterica]
MRSDDMVIDWWAKIQCDELCTVLGILAEKAFAILSNSIADERTASAITDMNSAKWNHQFISTIQDTLCIAQFHRNKPDAPDPKKIPTVKWQDMSDMLKMNNDDLLPLPSSNVGAVSNRKSMEDSDDEQFINKKGRGKRTMKKHSLIDKFSVEDNMPNINLSAPSLRDILDEVAAPSGSRKARSVLKNALINGISKEDDMSWKDVKGFKWDTQI